MTGTTEGGGVLVVGFGNGLRSDDGVGRVVAERLADDPRLPGATVLSLHQLTPELAVDISRASVVVLIDAALGGPPGEVVVRRVEPALTAAVPPATSFTHQLDAASLVALAIDLFGGDPRVRLVTIAGASMDVGDELSPMVAAAVPRAVQTVVRLVTSPRVGSPAHERRLVATRA